MSALDVPAAPGTKTYDGTTSWFSCPTRTDTTCSGNGNSDVCFTDVFDSRNFGIGTRTLTASGTVNDGNSGLNYSYRSEERRVGKDSNALDVTAATEKKTYDGTTSSTANPTITGSTIMPSGYTSTAFT